MEATTTSARQQRACACNRVDQIADVLGGVAERRGIAEGMQLRLDRAGSRMRVGEILAINIIGPVLASFLGIIFGNVLLGLVCAVILRSPRRRC